MNIVVRIAMIGAMAALPMLAQFDGEAARRPKGPSTQSVNDLSVETDYGAPYQITCRDGRVARNAQSPTRATVTVPCRTRPGEKLPRRGVRVEMVAEVSFRQSGEFVGECEASRRVTKRGKFTLSCETTVPGRANLPLTMSGAGSRIEGPFALPSGKVLVEYSFNGGPDDYFSAVVHQNNGDTYYLDSGYGPVSGRQEIFDIYERDTALLEIDIDQDDPSQPAPTWSVVFRDAFPE